MFNVNGRSVKISLALLLVAAFLIVPLSVAFASGQPNASCQAESSTPGQSASAPGSAFNTGGVAGTVYAGQQPQNSNNPNAVSQYDVACLQVSTH
jgi:hypothetical protein